MKIPQKNLVAYMYILYGRLAVVTVGRLCCMSVRTLRVVIGTSFGKIESACLSNVKSKAQPSEILKKYLSSLSCFQSICYSCMQLTARRRCRKRCRYLQYTNASTLMLFSINEFIRGWAQVL